MTVMQTSRGWDDGSVEGPLQGSFQRRMFSVVFSEALNPKPENLHETGE